MSDKLSTEAFAKKIKSKYPQYENIEDNVLVESILQKYPSYSEQVDFKKKEESLPESIDTSAPLESETPSTESSEMTIEEAKSIATDEASKGLWRQFSDWTVGATATVVGGVANLLGEDTGEQAAKNILKLQAEEKEKVKAAQKAVEADIVANPESSVEQFDVLEGQIESLKKQDTNLPFDADNTVDQKLKELEAQRDMMAPGVNKVKDANWLTTKGELAFAPTGSIEDAETGEDLGTVKGSDDDIFLTTYKRFLEETNPKKLEEYNVKVSTLEEEAKDKKKFREMVSERGGKVDFISQEEKLLDKAKSDFEIDANNWYNNTLNTSLELNNNKKRIDPETGEEYIFQERIDESDVLRKNIKNSEKTLVDYDTNIKELIASSTSASEALKSSMKNEYNSEFDKMVSSYQEMANTATTQEELDNINNRLKADVAKLEIDVTAKYSPKFKDITDKLNTENRQRASEYVKYKGYVDSYNNIIGSDDFVEYKNLISKYDNAYQNTEDIIKKYPEALKRKQELEDKQIELDLTRKERLKGDVGATVKSVLNYLNKKGSQYAESLLTLGRTATAGDDYDFLEKLGDIVEYNLEDNQVQSSSNERALVEKIVPFSDFRLTLDDSGEVVDVRDKDGYKVRNTMTSKKVIADFLSIPEEERPKEITEVNDDILFTKFVDTSVDMAALIYGGQFATKSLSALSKFNKFNKIAGLTSAGYVFEHNSLYNEAVEQGMSKDDAGKFAMTGAMIIGSLENLSPGDAIFDGVTKRKIARAYLTILGKGKATKGDVAKVIARNVSTEIAKENIQEISQTLADRAVKASANSILGNDYFDVEISKEELLETAILTTLSTGALAGKTQTSSQKISTLESNALYTAAKNKDQGKMFQKLDMMVEDGTIEQDAADSAKESIIEAKDLFSKLPEGKYTPVMESQILELQLLKSKALKEQKSSDAVFGKQYETTVNQIDKEINAIINSKSPRLFFNERVKNLNVEKAPKLSQLNQQYISGEITQEQYDAKLKSIVNPSKGVILDAIQSFGEKIGRKFSRKQALQPISIQKGIAIADAYEAMQSNPNDTEVKQAYDAFKQETKEQFEHFQSLGFKFMPQKEGQAYDTSKEMADDVSDNKTLKFSPTENEFETGDASVDHPLLEKTGVVIDGYELSFNDMFRAVHDMAGHAANGFQFGPLGQTNAYLGHAKTYSPLAQRALFSETMGQNSYNNFGSHLRNEDGKIPKKGEAGFVPLSMRPYAPQKAGLLPVELMTDVEMQRRVLDTPFQDLVLNNIDAELDNILAKIENQEDLTEQEIDDAKKYLDQIFNQVINSNITQQGKNIVAQYLELVENTIDNYENIITTKTVTVVETKIGTYAERGAIKKRVSEYSKQVRPARERLVGRIVQVEGLELPEGSVAVLNQDNDGVFIEVVDRESGTRSQRIDLGTNNPNEISIENVEMDEFDRPASVQLKFGDTNMTVVDPTLVMDLAIEKHEEVNPIFEQDIETIQYGIETVTEQEVSERIEKTDEEVRIEEENKTDIEKIKEQIQMSALSKTSLKGKGLQHLVDRLQNAFPNAPIAIINSKQAESILPGMNAGKSKGFAYGGKVYLVADNITMDTPIHEMAHIFNSYAKKYEPELYKKGLELVKGTKYEQDVRNNPSYSNLDEEGILEEALTQAIGEKGALLEKGKRKGFQAWLKKLFDIIKSKGIPVNLTLGQYTDFVAGRLTSGETISDITAEELNEIDSNPKLKALFSFVYDNGLDANNEAVVQSRILESLREAKKYVQEGMNAKLIAKATGWSQGPDGFWRFEVSDADLNFNPKVKSDIIDGFELFFARGDERGLSISEDNKIKISSLFDGNVLAEFYPELKNINVQFDTFNDNESSKGSAKTLMPKHIVDAAALLDNEDLQISDKDRSELVSMIDDFASEKGINYVSNDISLNPLVFSNEYKIKYLSAIFSQEVAEARKAEALYNEIQSTIESNRENNIETPKELYEMSREALGTYKSVRDKLKKSHPNLEKALFRLVQMSDIYTDEVSAYADMELQMMEAEAATVEERKDVFYNNLFEEIKSTFVHEQQHIAQALASVSKGGNMDIALIFDSALRDYVADDTKTKEEKFKKMFESYENLFGEQEARIVQDRMNMTQEQLNEDVVDFGDIKNSIVVSHAQYILAETSREFGYNLSSSSDQIISKMMELGVNQAQERIKPRFSFASETENVITTFYRNTNDGSNIMKDLDFETGEKMPSGVDKVGNLVFFTPSSTSFEGYGGRKFSAKINPKKSFYQKQPKIYSASEIKQLKEQGYDAIVTTKSTLNHSKKLKDAYEIIPIDKSIITQLKEDKEGFDDWFKDSKAINEDGTPQVYYHGTTRVFDNFDMGRTSQLVDAMFFSPDPEFANKYTEPSAAEKVRGDSVLPNIMPAYISVQNPFDYENPSHLSRLINSLSNMDVELFAISQGIDPSKNSRSNIAITISNNTRNNWGYLEPFGDKIKSLGYDSMYVGEKGVKNIAIFDPNQAKSIYSNDYSTAKFSKPTQSDIKKLVSDLVEQGFTKGQILESFSELGYDLNDVSTAFDSFMNDSIKNNFVKEQEIARQNKLVSANEDVSIWQGITDKLKNAGKYVANLLTPQGQLRKEVYTLIEDKGQNVKAMIANIQFSQRKLNRALKGIVDGSMKMNNPSYAEVIKDVEKALRGQLSFSELTKMYNAEVSEIVESMRKQVDSLSSQLIKSGFTQDDIKLKIEDNLGSYLTRSYALYDDPSFSSKTGPEIREAFAKDPNKSAILNNAINYLRREQSNQIYERLMNFYEGELTRVNQEYQSGQITKENYESQKSEIVDTLNNKDGKLTEAFENELLNVIDSILNKQEVSFLGVTGALSTKDSNVLKQRKEISPELRALMGEYNDPMYNYANTVLKIFSLIEQQKLLKKLKEVGMNDFIYQPNDPNRPGDAVRIAAESNSALAPLNGMYIDPTVLAEIQDVTSPEQRGLLLQRLFDFVSWTRESKTTLSPMTHMRNVIGNLGFIMMNGHIGFTSPKAGGNSIRTVMYDLNILDSKMAMLLGAKKILTDQHRQETEQLIQKLTALGVIRQNVSVNDIIDLSQNGDFDYYFSKNMDGYQLNENDRLKMMMSKGKKGIDMGRKKSQDLYQAEDDMFKIYAFAMERNRYESALRKKGMNEAEIDDFVAERVKNTYPTYSRVGKAVEYIRKLPFLGDFLSFKYESIRTMKNSILIAKSDMMDPDLRVQGAKRMASTIGYLGLKTAGFKLVAGFASNAFLGLFGGEDEEEKKKILACRKFLPEYDEFGSINITKINRDGTFEYTNVGAVDPHSDLEEVLTSIDLLSDPDYGDESLAIAISKSIGNYIGSYLGLSMGTEATLQIRDILSDPTLTDDAKFSKILSEMDVLLPGFVTQIDKVAKSEDKIKTMKSMLSGVRESKSDPRFKIRRELKNLSGKISSERSLTYKDKSVKQYRRSIKNLNEPIFYVKDLIDSARMLGVTQDEFRDMVGSPKLLLPRNVKKELLEGNSTSKDNIYGTWFNIAN